MPVPLQTRLRVWWLEVQRKARVLQNRMRRVPGCEACDDIPPKPAEWKATFLPQVRGTFGRDVYYCPACLMDDLEGVYTGGGPTLSCYARIERLRPGRVKPSGLYYNVEQGSERDHW